MNKTFIYRDNCNIFTGARQVAREREGADARRRVREWAEQAENCKFVTLDDFYESITFLELPAPGQPLAEPRDALPIDLDRRP